MEYGKKIGSKETIVSIVNVSFCKTNYKLSSPLGVNGVKLIISAKSTEHNKYFTT